MSTATEHQYLALRRYAFYLMRFCEEVTSAEAEETVKELYEPICTMLELLAQLSGTDFRNPVRDSSTLPDSRKASDLLLIVPRDAYSFDGKTGWYSFSFDADDAGRSAKIYTSNADVPAFALVSCYIQFLYDLAFNSDLAAADGPAIEERTDAATDCPTAPSQSIPSSRTAIGR